MVRRLGQQRAAPSIAAGHDRLAGVGGGLPAFEESASKGDGDGAGKAPMGATRTPASDAHLQQMHELALREKVRRTLACLLAVHVV